MGATIALVDVDVAVVGLGAMGSMAAWQLAQAGADVVGFEQYGLAHDRGAVGGESRLFRMAYHEGAEYVPLLRAARALWDELADAAGRPLFTPTGCLALGLPDLDRMATVLASVTEHDLEHEVLDADALAARFPQHRMDDGEIGILDAGGGVLRLEISVLSALQQARTHGARLHDRTPVRAIEPEDGRVAVITDGGVTRARRVVVTTGPWTTELVPSAPVTTKPVVLTWFVPDRVDDYLPDRFPAFIRDTGDMHVYGVPVMDGVSVKVSAGDVWEPLVGAHALTRDFDETALRPLSETVARLLPGLHPDPMRFGVWMEGYTPDRTALVGPLPDAPQILVLAGFSGHGFKMAPVFGRIARDLALDGGTPFDLSPMRPTRFATAE